jgi:hypothetical protein
MFYKVTIKAFPDIKQREIEREMQAGWHLGIWRAISSRLSDGVSGVLSNRRLGFTARVLW